MKKQMEVTDNMASSGAHTQHLKGGMPGLSYKASQQQ